MLPFRLRDEELPELLSSMNSHFPAVLFSDAVFDADDGRDDVADRAPFGADPEELLFRSASGGFLPAFRSSDCFRTFSFTGVPHSGQMLLEGDSLAPHFWQKMPFLRRERSMPHPEQ